MRNVITGLLVIIFLMLHIARVETAQKKQKGEVVVPACVTEDEMLRTTKIRFPNAYRAKLFLGKSAREVAWYSNAPYSTTLRADKASVVEMGGSAISISFFEKDCKMGEIVVTQAFYMGVMYIAGQFPGTLIH